MDRITSMRARRVYWVNNIHNATGSFSVGSKNIIAELSAETAGGGVQPLLDQLRICGAMPEQYARDSSEEKLYSKYTDAVVSESFNAIGLDSITIETRSDSADVQARTVDYSLVADAKAFRLTRTARNQKDFKVQAMDDWRGGLDYAVVIGPIYQFLPRTSQIYLQAVTRNVCLLSYSHLACMVTLADRLGSNVAKDAFHRILDIVNLLHPSKSAVDYWTGINRALIESLLGDSESWEMEKRASLDGLSIAKEESLQHLRSERNRLLGLSHRQAIEELVRLSGVDSRIRRVESINHGNLLESEKI